MIYDTIRYDTKVHCIKYTFTILNGLLNTKKETNCGLFIVNA